MSDAFPVYPIFALLSSVGVLIPLPWHIQAWNAGTCLFMIWTSVACLNLAINSIVWHGNAIDLAPIWCDISTRIIAAVAVAIPMASLCINRRLYKIATVTTVNVSSAEKRRAVMVDLSLGLGIPFLQVAMQYIVSGHRYDIYEDIGCYPFTYNTLLAYLLSLAWPVVIGMISAVYCILTLRAFYKRRAQFSQFLSGNKSLNPNRYFRLMALAATDLLCTIPISLYGMVLNLTDSRVYPWISWADTHANWLSVRQYPAGLWRLSHSAVVAFELTRWAPVFCAVVFVAFFGFAAEARRNYRDATDSVFRLLHFEPLRLKLLAQRSFAYPGEKLPSYSGQSPSPSKHHILLASTPTLALSDTSEDFHFVTPPYPLLKNTTRSEEWLSATPSTTHPSSSPKATEV